MSSGLSNWFGWNASATPSDELPEIFPLEVSESEFVKVDVVTIYQKILTDVLERIQGLTDDQIALLWDNCVASESADGLITMLAKAMTDKKDLFLVYDKALKLVRVATQAEATIIAGDYKTKGESKAGVYISFKNFERADMVKLYSALEYCTVAALHKSMNLSKAIQLKMNDMRSSVSLTDSTVVVTQAQTIAASLADGKDILLDAKDAIETTSPDLTAVKESILFLNQKRSFYLGMPEAYINGEQTGGMGTTGENDTKAIERGLKNYYFSILKPVLEAVFGAKVTYKSQDFRQIAGAMEVLKTLSLIDESLISEENKLLIINGILDLPADATGDVDREAAAKAKAEADKAKLAAVAKPPVKVPAPEATA